MTLTAQTLENNYLALTNSNSSLLTFDTIQDITTFDADTYEADESIGFNIQLNDSQEVWMLADIKLFAPILEDYYEQEESHIENDLSPYGYLLQNEHLNAFCLGLFEGTFKVTPEQFFNSLPVLA